jgi:DNA-binding transcriptional LysR family regulator
VIRHVTFRQLQVFAEAARQLSFARAAELLHLTQPAVSMQIRQLESALGLALFERVNRTLALTAAGRLFRQHALRVLGELQDAQQALDALQGLKGGTVTVGLVSTAKYFAPRLLAQFNRRHPQVDVRLLVGNREMLVNQLKDNELDLAVMGRPPGGLDALAEPLANNPHVLVGPPGHPYAGARQIDMHELRGETFLMREEGSGTRLVMEAMFAQHLFKPRRMTTMGSNETVKQAVMAGMGLSLLSLHTLALELKLGEVSVLDVSGTPVVRTWHAVHMAGKQLSPAARAFRQFLLEQTERYLAANFKLPAHLSRRGAARRKAAAPARGKARRA